MKLNKFFGLGLFVFVMMFSVVSVSAVDLVTPDSYQNFSAGSLSVLITFTNKTDVTLNSTGELNESKLFCNYSGTWTHIPTTGLTCNQTACTSAFTVSATHDDAGVSCNASIANSTDYAENASSNDGITFDSTDPNIGLFVDLDSEYQSFGRGIEYKCTTGDDIDGSPTESFSIAHPSGDDTSSTTLVTQSVKQLFVDTDYPGDFVFTCTSTDYTGNSASDTATVTIDELGNAKLVKGNGNSNSNSMWIWVIIVLLVVWIWYSSKK